MNTKTARRIALDSNIDVGRANGRPPLDRRLRVALVGILVARIAVNGGLRVVYPFLAVIAAGVGVSFHTIALLVAARSLAGLAAPLLARWTLPSRWNAMMLTALVLVAAGAVAILLAAEMAPTTRIVLLGAGFAATGVARPLFELPMQAWLTMRVPHTQRGRVIGLAELGWALSLAVTVPVAGLLIGIGGWRYAFVVVFACCAAGFVALRELCAPAVAQTVATAVPADVAAPDEDRQGRAASSGDRSSTSAVGICVATALTVMAGEMVLVTHGSWMSRTFGLSTEKIGAITVVIVVAELAGSGLVATFADRLDLRRTLLGALLASTIAAVLLGRADDVTTAVILLGIWFVAFEAAVVSLVALATTAGTGCRAEPRVFGWMMAAMAGGNAAGATIAPLLFVDDDIHTTGLVATALGLSAAAVVVLERRWRVR
ncbi:MAG: MFS transporter [Ilumatobacter sp.]|uniref:MFS transporter n=1 Tax=Ilumatobacter sp. TaxID=1967498 RepID=UPI003C779FF3